MHSGVILGDGVLDELQVHLAVQLCDVNSHQNKPRICGDDRTLLSKKSVRSFFDSIVFSSTQRPLVHFHVCLILDSCTAELAQYCRDIQLHFANDKLHIEVRDLAPRGGLADSIEECYQWMQTNGQHIVAQIQDDYLFYTWAIDDCIDVLLQIQRESETDAVVCHCQWAQFWRTQYHNRSTPRHITVGRHDYWIQIYDTSCTFFTTHHQFSQHWEQYNFFLEICRIQYDVRSDWGLESQSLNHMFTRKGVLGVSPMRSLSHHVQSDFEMDPHQDWRILWDATSVELSK